MYTFGLHLLSEDHIASQAHLRRHKIAMLCPRMLIFAFQLSDIKVWLTVMCGTNALRDFACRVPVPYHISHKRSADQGFGCASIFDPSTVVHPTPQLCGRKRPSDFIGSDWPSVAELTQPLPITTISHPISFTFG
jgi:hypothetical protein